MSSLKCQNCQVINWSTNKVCLRCQSPLIGQIRPPTLSQRNSPENSSFLGKFVALGIICFIILVTGVFLIVKPSFPGSKDTAQSITNQPLNTAAPISKNDPNIPGVPPINLAPLEQEVLSSTKGGELYKVVYKDAMGNVIPTPGEKETCNKEITGISSSAYYEKVGSDVVASVNFEVKGVCGPVNLTMTISRRYLWKDINGFNQWIYDPDWDSRKSRENDIKEAQDFERELREKAEKKEERQEKRKLAREEEERKKNLQSELDKLRQ
jgi:hypothetical protein